jgi:hypothetical protein
VVGTVGHYPTGICALAEWKERPPAIDLVVVSEMLPMLTTEEFIQAARGLLPFATIVVVRAGLSLPSVEIAGDASYAKPLSVEAVRDMVLRVTPIRAQRPKVGDIKSNLPISSMNDVVYGTTI